MPRWSSTASVIAWTGPASRAPAADERVDAAGRAVLPGFVDSHAHLVFAGERGAEFAARMAGLPYSAGGIRSTVAATRAASDAELLGQPAAARRRDARAGHHHVRVQVRLRAHRRRRGQERGAGRAAHARGDLPRRARGAAGVRRPTRPDTCGWSAGPMLEACAPHARWVDVFCERGAFDGDQAARDARGRPEAAGCCRGCTPISSDTDLASRSRSRPSAASADHCTYLSEDDIAALAASGTVATLLPGVEFSTRQPYPDARRLLDAGVQCRYRHRLQPGIVLHLQHGVLHRAGGQGHADDDAGSALVGDRGRRHGAAPRRRRSPGRGRTSATWSCWTRRRTPTWPTGQAFRRSPPSGGGPPGRGNAPRPLNGER